MERQIHQHRSTSPPPPFGRSTSTALAFQVYLSSSLSLLSLLTPSLFLLLCSPAIVNLPSISDLNSIFTASPICSEDDAGLQAQTTPVEQDQRLHSASREGLFLSVQFCGLLPTCSISRSSSNFAVFGYQWASSHFDFISSPVLKMCRGICLEIFSCDRTWMNKAVDEQGWVPASLIAGFKKIN
ncbi:hypothetical protein LXL04_020112 [Taraxacum kok-saghyz]